MIFKILDTNYAKEKTENEFWLNKRKWDSFGKEFNDKTHCDNIESVDERCKAVWFSHLW